MYTCIYIYIFLSIYLSIYLQLNTCIYIYIYISYPTEWGPSLLAKLVQITIITIVYDPHNLVGDLEHEFYFSIQLGISSSQLTNSYFFRGVGIPPTSIFRWCYKPRNISGGTILYCIACYIPYYIPLCIKYILSISMMVI